MKNKWNLVYAAIATALLLSACGTTKTGNGQTDETTGTVGNTNQGTIGADSTGKTNFDITKESKLTESDEQNYSINVLPQYKLTSEEPGRDILYFDADESIFMRIETMVFDEATYNNAVDSMLAGLEASSDGATPDVVASPLLPSGDGITEVDAFTVTTETGPVTGIVFKRGSLIVRITIFDSIKGDHYERFIRMGETIVTK